MSRHAMEPTKSLTWTDKAGARLHNSLAQAFAVQFLPSPAFVAAKKKSLNNLAHW